MPRPCRTRADQPERMRGERGVALSAIFSLMRWPRTLLLAITFTGVGCGQLWLDSGPDAGPDTSDAGPAVFDALAVDGMTSMDAGIDTPMDAGNDAPMDSPMDAGNDAPMDAGNDALMDVGNDAPMDAGTDAGPLFVYEDCDMSLACDPGFRCEGFVMSIGVGRCVPTKVPEGAGNPCTAVGECGLGLRCLGLGRGFGVCRPDWMQGSFGERPEEAIPDGASELIRTLTAYGLSTVDVDVETQVVFDHPSPSDLQIYLSNSSGTEVVVYDGPAAADPPGRVALRGAVSGFSGDEPVNGVWTLRIVDSVVGNTGTLLAWSVTIASRPD